MIRIMQIQKQYYIYIYIKTKMHDGISELHFKRILRVTSLFTSPIYSFFKTFAKGKYEEIII